MCLAHRLDRLPFGRREGGTHGGGRNLDGLERSAALVGQRMGVEQRQRAGHGVVGRDPFEQIGQRDELKGVPFDRRQAAEALKLYLGD